MLQKTSIELNLKLEDVSNETINIQNIKILFTSTPLSP